MNRKRILLGPLLFFLAGCLPMGAKSRNVTLPEPPVPPPAVSMDRLNALADLSAMGHKLAEEIEANGAEPHSEPTILNLRHWGSVRAGTSAGVVRSHAVADANLAKAMLSEREADEKFRTEDAEYKMSMSKLGHENIVTATPKAPYVEEAEANKAKVAKHEAWKKKVAWTALSGGGIVVIVVGVFLWLRLGSTAAIIWGTLSGTGYSAGMILYIYSFYRNTIIALVLIWLGLFVVLGIGYALWAAVFPKRWKDAIFAWQKGREAVAEESATAREALDKAVSASMDVKMKTDIKELKAKNGLEDPKK